MKTSNILILTVIVLFFVCSAASNMALKKEFDKIDKSDPTYGFKRHNLPDFHYVKLQGKTFGLTEIQQGNQPQLRMITLENSVKWEVLHDTLIVTYQPQWNNVGYADFSGKPSIYIVVPKLLGLESQNATCRVRKLTTDSLHILQTGRGLALSEVNAKKLNVELKNNGVATIDRMNNFGQTFLSVADSSALEINKNVFADLKTEFDSTAQIKVPGSLLKIISKQ